MDQTRELVGLPVVKVVVPGLRHFWPVLHLDVSTTCLCGWDSYRSP